LIALYHHHAQETSNDCRSEENEDDRDSDCPDARRKEALEGVVFIDEWLSLMSLEYTLGEVSTYHEEGPCCVISEDCSSDYEHCEAHKTVQLRSVSTVLLLFASQALAI